MTQINYDKRNASDEAIELPGSKSMAARALVIHYIRGGEVPIRHLPDCDDTRELGAAIMKLRSLIPSLPIYMEQYKDGNAPVEADFNLGTGGTSLRFFTALAASLPGLNSVIDCSDALRRRPLAGLTDALRQAGAEIDFIGSPGYPPFRIIGKRLHGGTVRMDGKVSSQFISALIMVSDLWERPLDLKLEGGMVSRPYVEMTEKMTLLKDDFEIEPDWSAASYFYEMALVCPDREIKVARLCRPEMSVQGDSRCASLFETLGVMTEWLPDGSAVLRGDGALIAELAASGDVLTMDLGDVPDLTPALAVGMCLAGIRFRYLNVAHLRHKECDRMAVIAAELSKIGFALDCGESTMEWTGRRLPVGENEVIDSHADHRMAMAFALAASKLGYITIRDAACVSKSFPDYFSQIAKEGFVSRRIGDSD